MTDEKIITNEDVPLKKPTRRRTSKKTTEKKINVRSVQKVGNKKTTKDPSSTENEETGQVDSKKEFTHEEIDSIEDLLPTNYQPEYFKHGVGVGFLMIPSRVFSFIEDNVTDWYLKIESYPYFTGKDFIYSILYYIIKDGFVIIQELKNNEFYRLTINEEGALSPNN